MTDTDVIDSLVGIAPGSPLDAARARRPEARKHAQASYVALFGPSAPADVTPQERFAVATFVAGLHRQAALEDFYRSKLAASGASETLQSTVTSAIAAAAAQGPYGNYPAGPLTAEDAPGPLWRASAADRTALGARIAAAFEHTHMLVYHPRDSAPEFLQALLDAGWSTTAVVTLSQLVSFLSFQIRVVAGLRVLAAHV